MTIPNTAKAQKQVPITRINRIKGHRIFRDFSWPADLHEFGRFNLIYGWNGSGKSTLAGIFQSIEKRTVITEGSVEFTINGNSIVGASLPTTAVLPIVRVFTRDVVSASVFAAGTSLAPIFYFGESNVENEKRLETVKAEHKNAELELVNAQRDRQRKDKELEQLSIDQAKVIKETLTAPGSSYNNYDRRNFRSKCEGLSKVDYLSKRLSKDEKGHLGLQKSAQAKPKIEQVSDDIPRLNDLIHDVGALLRKTVVSQVIDSLTTAPRLATWVHEGLALHPRDAENTDCHFCGNAIAPERLQALEAHFNDQYRRVIQAIDALKGKIDANIQLTTGLSLPDPAKLYDHLVPSYQESSTSGRVSWQICGMSFWYWRQRSQQSTTNYSNHSIWIASWPVRTQM